MLIVDSREPKDMQAQLLAEFSPGDVTVQMLDAGDFLIFDIDGCSLGIERKTPNDLLHAYKEDRLYDQLRRLSEQYSHPTLLIEGGWEVTPRKLLKINRRTTGWRNGPVQMILWTAQRKFGYQMLWTDSLIGTADTLRVLHAYGNKRCFDRSVPEGSTAVA